MKQFDFSLWLEKLAARVCSAHGGDQLTASKSEVLVRSISATAEVKIVPTIRKEGVVRVRP